MTTEPTTSLEQCQADLATMTSRCLSMERTHRLFKKKFAAKFRALWQENEKLSTGLYELKQALLRSSQKHRAYEQIVQKEIFELRDRLRLLSYLPEKSKYTPEELLAIKSQQIINLKFERTKFKDLYEGAQRELDKYRSNDTA